MILTNGAEVRLTDPHRHKFADAMSEYLWMLSLDSSYDDSSGDCEAPTGWFARFGKRILYSDSQGFVWADNLTTEAAAITTYELLATEYGMWGDDTEEGDE